ncbi:5-formyltetrahydrofolate cyclo-ligase [Parabacteroides sp. PM5-20]|uniref:5-formyltetrahydrofolate cyclo-ligase n=1 Tax=unclassified Parabacteroides TaxID=2649774 RepID=UPI001EF2F0E9|nr:MULTISPECIES: 5-formyltetrahydrofolate cyclo-ligase [unclassified Parabacteroides]MDH6534520.1 5-formyltetrahydrofolate cyclo-ligase [Parabacteroides sp. PM5-20]
MACLKKEYSKTWLSEQSAKALALLEQTDFFQRAHCIALYHALPGEVETADFIEKWAPQKQLLLPLVDGENLKLLPYTDKQSLQKGAYGILEPGEKPGFSVDENEIDLLIVPGIAFDRQGNRLGRGKGYYDRLLSSLSNPKIGLCFSFQLHEQIPTETFDIQMDGVITEKEVLFKQV